jgi:hypothetical protein
MPENDPSLNIGDIVEIVDSEHEELGLCGKIRDLGPPLIVTFTYVETFKPNQVKKVDTPATLTFHQLRSRAKEAGIRAVGTRDELLASVQALKDEEVAAELAETRGLDVGAAKDFPLGAIVQINDPPDELRHNCRGKVIDGPSVNVRLTNKDFEVEDKVYPKGKLIRVG